MQKEFSTGEQYELFYKKFDPVFLFTFLNTKPTYPPLRMFAQQQSTTKVPLRTS